MNRAQTTVTIFLLVEYLAAFVQYGREGKDER